jgi:hypothetical protein
MLLEALEGPRHRYQKATVQNLPIPQHGWSTRDKYANAFNTKALQYCPATDNWMWIDGRLTIRPGFKPWTTGLPASPIYTVMEYSAANAANTVFSAVEDEIYNTTASGAVGSPVVTGLGDPNLSPFWQWTMFASVSGQYLVLANGVDAVRNFDGTTWTTPTITGVTSADLVHVEHHKGRLWFTEKNSMNAWYLIPFGIGGTATRFSIGAYCKRGGYLVAIASWTIDGGSGQDDLLAFITSQGEVLIYAGVDPNSVSDWSLVGIFSIQKPIGRRCYTKFGGDLVIYTEGGPVKLGQVMASIDERDALSDPIRSDFIGAVASASAAPGWEPVWYKKRGWLFCNVPQSVAGEFEQYIYSPHMEAWFRFTGLNAYSWVESGRVMHFGGNGATYKWDDGDIDDDGDAVVAEIAFGWWNYGSNQNKLFTLMRPHLFSDGVVTPTMSFKVDYDETPSFASVEATLAGDGSAWDVEFWDLATWGGSTLATAEWYTATNQGMVGAPRMRFSTISAQLSLTAVDVAFIPGGIL